MTVWVVDDDRAILAFMSIALERVNVEIHTFFSLNSAIAAINEGVAWPDLCIVDWTMKDGRAWTLHDLMPSVRFVVMSGNPEVNKHLPAGVEWLEKPFRLSVLHQVVLQENL